MVRKEEADTDPQTPRGRAPDTDPGLGPSAPGAPRIIVASQTGDADPDELLGNLAKQRTLPPKIVRSTAGQSKAAYAAVGAPAVRQDTPPPEPAVVVNDSSAGDEPASQRAVVRGLAGASANTTVLIPGRTRPRFAIAVLVGGVVAALAAVIILAIGRKEPEPASPTITVVPTQPTQASTSAAASPNAAPPPAAASANANAPTNAATATTTPTASIAPTAPTPPATVAPALNAADVAPTAKVASPPSKPSPASKPAASSTPRELRLLPDEP